MWPNLVENIEAKNYKLVIQLHSILEQCKLYSTQLYFEVGRSRFARRGSTALFGYRDAFSPFPHFFRSTFEMMRRGAGPKVRVAVAPATGNIDEMLLSIDEELAMLRRKPVMPGRQQRVLDDDRLDDSTMSIQQSPVAQYQPQRNPFLRTSTKNSSSSNSNSNNNVSPSNPTMRPHRAPYVDDADDDDDDADNPVGTLQNVTAALEEKHKEVTKSLEAANKTYLEEKGKLSEEEKKIADELRKTFASLKRQLEDYKKRYDEAKEKGWEADDKRAGASCPYKAAPTARSYRLNCSSARTQSCKTSWTSCRTRT